MQKSKQALMLFMLLAAYALQGRAQNTISYTYDQAGNRISRITIPIGQNKAKRNTETTDSVVVKDVLGKLEVKIFPNPTKGALGVDLTGINPDIITRISVYGGQGAQLYNAVAIEGLNPLDFSKYPEGWYILRIEAGTERKEYKIIKQ